MYKKREIIHNVIESLRQGNQLTVAVSKSGLRSLVTFWNWRKANPRLNNLIKRAEEICDNRRTTIVEDALLKAAAEGNTTAMIFYLTNRRMDTWADRRNLIHSGEIKGAETRVIVIYANKPAEVNSNPESRLPTA